MGYRPRGVRPGPRQPCLRGSFGAGAGHRRRGWWGRTCRHVGSALSRLAVGWAVAEPSAQGIWGSAATSLVPAGCWGQWVTKKQLLLQIAGAGDGLGPGAAGQLAVAKCADSTHARRFSTLLRCLSPSL